LPISAEEQFMREVRMRIRDRARGEPRFAVSGRDYCGPLRYVAQTYYNESTPELLMSSLESLSASGSRARRLLGLCALHIHRFDGVARLAIAHLHAARI
jgi:hypothetical protein